MPSLSSVNPTATTEIYTLSLHDALPISIVPEDLAANLVAERQPEELLHRLGERAVGMGIVGRDHEVAGSRSEEHTSELQSLTNLVCRLLLEKKKKKNKAKRGRKQQ